MRPMGRRTVVISGVALMAMLGAGCSSSAARAVHGRAPCGQGAFTGTALRGTAETIAPTGAVASTVLHVAPSDLIRCNPDPPALHKDVVYSRVTTRFGERRILRMDVQVPHGPGPFPAVVYVPGGGFNVAPRQTSLDRRTYVAEAGFVVASITYRTVEDGIYADAARDVNTAIRFLRAQQPRFRIDGRHIALWGDSAGGYLAALTAAARKVAAFGPRGRGPTTRVDAVVDVYGLSDLTRIAADFDAAEQFRHLAPSYSESQFVNGKNSGRNLIDDAEAQRANPITYIDAQTPPFLLFHGSADTVISPSQTLLLHQALRRAGVSSTRYVVAGAGHGGRQWSSRQVMDLIVRFLHRTTR